MNVSSTQVLYQSAPFQAAILFVSGPLVTSYAGFYRDVVLDSGGGELQHVPGDRKDIPHNITGARSPQDMPRPCIWVHTASRPVYAEEHPGILVAILGMGLYSFFSVQENKEKQLVDLSSLVKEEDAYGLLAANCMNTGLQDKDTQDVMKSDKDSAV
ncbi:hypothetical protein MLD38_011654 [Melastoma candidum]|uniref:Uncharacterized protein n=1 Tax=Melastoma candidum TaxID=119954 RepID=A0ACB9RC32_9MYRT|nr:hypothetical protein MLD38_011654 [Melastoma candidum]